MVLTVLIVLAISAAMVVGIGTAYMFINWYRAHSINQTNAVYATRYVELVSYLDKLKEPPRVCKFCSTIGGRHYNECPYIIINYAMNKAESIR